MSKLTEILLCLSFLAVSCTSNEIPAYHRQIVVEGWIENGRNPVVRLSATTPVSTDKQSQDSLLENTIDDADVCIKCDGKAYRLHPKLDETFYPSHIYTSEELVGTTGATYQLFVKTQEGEELEAATSIPNSPMVLETGLKESGGGEGYTIYAKVEDKLTQHLYYKVFVNIDKTHKEEFCSSFWGENDNALLASPNPKLPVYGYTKGKKKGSHVYFQPGDNVTVKLCCVDSVAYGYWSEYAKMLELSRNPIFTYQKSLPTNIHGGIGYWFGYGATRFDVSVP